MGLGFGSPRVWPRLRMREEFRRREQLNCSFRVRCSIDHMVDVGIKDQPEDV